MRQRVQEAIERLGYRPSAAARSMRGASFTIGMELPHLTNQFLVEVADGAREALAGTAYQLVVAPADGAEHGAIEALADHRVDGIIAISPLTKPDWLEEIAKRVPLVMVGRHDDPTWYDTVVGDDINGAVDAMEHLLGLGHRRIVHITESEAVTAFGSGTPHALRLEAYLGCMRRAGLDNLIHVVHSKEEEREARAVTRDLLKLTPRPTAIFAGHDSLAIGVLAAMAEAGVTSRDISVVGYDNTSLAEHPLISLTSVDQSGPELGRRAVAMLLERIQGRQEPDQYVLTPRLIVRTSTSVVATR